jgi:sulfur relay protein TusB/DsrH
MAKTLFLIDKSPSAEEQVITILGLVSKGDAVCFIQDGVYFSNKPSVDEGLQKKLSQVEGNDVKFFYLEPDLVARSLSFDGEKVDYDGLLDLIEEYDNVYH